APALQNPLALGIDLVVHSTTKYLGGHADLLGGALVMDRDDLHEKLKFSQNALGAIPSAFDCWLTLRGIKTLAVRMETHCDNAEALAKFLKAHKAIAKAHYPGLPDDPGHAIAKKQMRRFAGMLSFEARDPSRIAERLKRLAVIVPAESQAAWLASALRRSPIEGSTRKRLVRSRPQRQRAAPQASGSMLERRRWPRDSGG